MLNHGYTEPIRYQQTTKTKGVQIKNLLPTSSQQEKNPEKARGLQVPTTEKYIFNFFDPPAFCTKKQEARGLHSMSAIFAKLHSLHSKVCLKDTGGEECQVVYSQGQVDKLQDER